MPQFFQHNSGRSIFNLDHIVRIEVDEMQDLDSLEKKLKTRYMVTMTTDVVYYIEKEEYLRLLHAIGFS